MNTQVKAVADLEQIKEAYNQELASYQHQILICGGAGCISSGCAEIEAAVAQALQAANLTEQTKIIQAGCVGTCAVGPVIVVLPEKTFYTNLTPEKVERLIPAHLLEGQVIEEYTFWDSAQQCYVQCLDDIEFFRQQVRIALNNCGSIEHASIQAYIARDGYLALANTLARLSPEAVVAEVTASGLMGRGGAGFPTGIKWEAGRKAEAEQKYLVCNADEGDPGAFMDRSIIEGDPHALIEGMAIAGYAIGASVGYVYVRAEYPLAIERLDKAIDQARSLGLLGQDLFGSGFDFDLEIRIGAGAFVCGEETALMASIEGQRGEPRQKPPFPFQAGLFGMPTIINNVETLANVAPIMLKGATWYAGFGTEQAKGTKVFALAGDIANTGIVEVPIGTPLGQIMYDLGGGVPGDKKLKAVQIGGPSGGCITLQNLNVPMDYADLKQLGAIMGSGGFIAMNEDTCMVDTARYFMDFIQDESCGKCAPCRIGTKRMLETLERITKGQGQAGDIEKLQELGAVIQDSAICGLGQTAPNPVLSAIENFREEFEEHINQGYCRAGVCAELFASPCQNTCPAHIDIPGYLALIVEGRFVDAFNLIRQDNPLPAVCGRVCTRPCEAKCRRGTVDEAVAICSLKRFAADYALAHPENYVFEADPKNGKSVAIVGAGPAGLSAAFYLARMGYQVDIYEAEAMAGGVLAYGIPEYRLPMDVLNQEISLIEQEGVTIHLSTAIGRDLSFDDIRNRVDAVFVGVGTQLPLRMKIEGEDLPGVLPATDFLYGVNLKGDQSVGQKVVVVGGSNTAIDAARTARRLGAEVTMVYRRTREAMPALDLEIEEALEEGVELSTQVQPVRVVAGPNGRVAQLECQRTGFGEFDSSGRKKAVNLEGSNFMLEADTVIVAISQYGEFGFADQDELELTDWGTLAVRDQHMMTSLPGVFAGGDAVRGPDSVIQAIADGKNAAVGIDLYLGGTGVLNKGPAIQVNQVFADEDLATQGRFPMEMLELSKRCTTFEEAVQGYHTLPAMAEAMRCLHCERR
ncbi:MAG: NADH-quinone oxidoreductase subunit NuoF [Micrococcales bacterium]|nr:NADH-quinone oxidoreductase subunit NuoF [Micrococcales bacterium]